MSFNQFVAILRARWLVLLIILAVTLAVAALITAVLPKRYSAGATVLVDIKSPDPVAGMVLPGIMSPTYMATQVDLLTSERVARRVVEMLRLNEDPEMRAQWMAVTKGVGNTDAWIAETLMTGLRVTPSRESNIIKVEAINTDPVKAALYANAFVQAFISVTGDLRVEPAKQFGTNFSELGGQLRKRLEAAQARLSNFQRETGLMATDERMDVELARLSDLSSQVLQLQTMKSDIGIRVASAKSRGTDTTPDAMSNTLIAQIRSQLIGEEAKLDQLTQRMGDAHPMVIESRAAVASLRNKLEGELGRVSRSLGTTSGMSDSRLRDSIAALENQRAKLTKLREQRNIASVMQRDIENLQRAYDAVESRVSQATMESKATQTNLAVIESAVPPVSPSSPKTMLNMAIALVLGSLVSAGTVLLIEFIDRRVRSNEDISKDLKLPLIGVMLKTPNASRGLLTKRTAPWVINRTLPAPTPNA